MKPADEDFDSVFNKIFEQAVILGNRTANDTPESDLWEIADGLLAGAVQFWLYSRQPCGDPRCEDCAPVSTAEARMIELRKLLQQYVEDSDYYHTPTDTNAGRA